MNLKEVIENLKRDSKRYKSIKSSGKVCNIFFAIGATSFMISPFFEGVVKASLLGLGLCLMVPKVCHKLTFAKEIKENNIKQKYYDNLLKEINKTIYKKEVDKEIFPEYSRCW